MSKRITPNCSQYRALQGKNLQSKLISSWGGLKVSLEISLSDDSESQQELYVEAALHWNKYKL